MMKKLFGLALLLTVMLCFHSNQATAQSPCGVPDGWMVGDVNTNAGVPATPAVTTFGPGCSVFDPFAAGFTTDPIFPVDDVTTAFIISQTVDLGDGTSAEVVVGTVLEGETFDFAGDAQFATAPVAGTTYNVTAVVFCQDEVDAATGNFLVGGIIGAMGGEDIREVFQLVEVEASVSPAPPLTVDEVNGLFQSATISSFLGFPIAYDVSEEDPYQVIFSDDPADCPVDCAASFGTPAYPVDLVACPDDVITVGFDGNASVDDGFTTIVLATAIIPLIGTDPIIAGGSEDNSGVIEVEFNGLGDPDVLDLTGGNYTLHVFNILEADAETFVGVFNTLSEASPSGLVSALDLAAALDANGVCYALDLTGQAFTVVGADDAACSDFGLLAGGALALAGSDETSVSGCAGSDNLSAIDATTTGSGGDTGSYDYVITDNNNNLLFPTTTQPPFDLSGAPAGICHIWGVAYEGTLTVTMGDSVDDLVADALELSDNFIEVTRLEAPIIMVTEECDAATGEFTLSMTITGGQAPYAVSGAFNFGDDDMYMGESVSTQLADGETYEIIATGALGAGCISNGVTGEVTCSKCDNDAGTMSLEALVACADGTLTPVFNQDSTMQAGSVALVAVHTSPTEVAGTILAIYPLVVGSAMPAIAFDDLTDGMLGTTYYASLVIAVLDDTGNADLTNACTKVAPGQPITFFDGVATEATVEVTCDDVTGEATVTLSAPAGTYDVSGTFTFDAAGGDAWNGDAVSVILTDGDFYDITVVDVASNCPAPFNATGEVVCSKCDITDLITIETDCDEVSGEFTLTISAPDGTYDLSGTFTFDATAGDAWDGSPVSVILTDGESYAFTVVDFSGECPNPADFAGEVTCTKCDNDPGTVVGAGGAPVVLCTGESATAQSATAPEIQDGSVGIWAVHTNADGSAGDILAINNSGTFTFADLDGGVVGETYYISFVVFPLDDNGDLDLTASCGGVAPGLPVQFTPGVEANPTIPAGYSLDCNGTTGLAEIMMSFVSDNAPISIVTDFGASFTDLASGDIVSDIIANGDFSITATDAAGCTITVTGNANCVKTAVEWLPLNGEVLDRGNLLKWGTGSEENNDYFQVLRSNDGVNFEAVGQIGGSGTTFSFNTYDFLDNSAPVGISYYQIKQVDFDGASTTSNIISLTRSKTEFGVQGVAPVPAISYVEVTFSSPSETAITATVYDVAGRVLTTLNNEANAGINALRVNTNTFSPGIYFIHILNNEQTEIVKFVKE